MGRSWGSTPLIIAATFGKTEVARALIEAGADLGMRNNHGSTPLHVAAFLCRPEIVEAMLSVDYVDHATVAQVPGRPSHEHGGRSGHHSHDSTPWAQS